MRLNQPVASFGDSPVKQFLRLSFFALAFVCLPVAVSAQTANPTPDPFVAQITASTADTFARDISGDGRFVVIESAGNIATVDPRNADSNREIFLFDFAQRRIFQLTDTRSVLVDTTKTGADRTAFGNIAVEISNNNPTISRDGKWIAFSSNAPTPFQFFGDTLDAAGVAAAKADGNTELFLYRVPDVPAASLTSGDTPALTDLRQNAFTRVTDTPASQLPHAGVTGSANAFSVAPFVADDNRGAQINDDGSRVAFVSTRNLLSVNLGRLNADASPEIFVYNNSGVGSVSQITNTVLTDNLIFTDNPSISGNPTGTSTIAFVSNAKDLRSTNSTDAASNVAAGNADGDAEVFIASYNGTTVTSAKQATRTKRVSPDGRVSPADVINFLNPGRRMSRDGNFVAFESVAADPKGDNGATNVANRAVFVYNVSADTFTQVGPRAANDEREDVLRFPTFAGNDPSRVIFTSDLNLKSDGTRATVADAAGLNRNRIKQIFSATVAATTAITRLTNLTGTDPGNTMQAFVSDTQERISFSLANFEFGTGNPDRANEAFYLVTPPAPLAGDTPAASSALQFLTGASRREVSTPAASPSPTPSPVPGLAPGMLAYVRTTGADVTLAPSAKNVCPAVTPSACDGASESGRRPPLPVELNGVSLSINGAAAGLYFVSPTEIQFVVPPGLAAQTGTNTYPVTISVRSDAGVRTVRTTLQIVAAQPDVFTSTNGPGGRAVISNVTNPLLATGTPEPFNVTTTYVDGTGQSVTAATKLRVVLTGVRDPAAQAAQGLAASTFTVRLTKSDNSTVDLTGTAIAGATALATDAPGIFTLDFTLPATLAGAGDVAITVVVTTGGGTFTSRPADTAPRFRIN